MTVVRPRPAVLDLPAYRPGRSAQDAATQHGLASAVKLASNEAPYAPLPSVARAMRDAMLSVNRYPDPRAMELRALLAERHGTHPDRVTVGAGSATLLFQLGRAFVDPSDEVAFPWLSFEAYPIVAKLSDGLAVPVPLMGTTADVDALIEAVNPRTKLLILAEPNNPTGTAVGGRAVQRLVAGVPDTCLVVIDEAYYDFASRSDPMSAIELVETHENVVVLRTFSKAFGLAGLRIGYAIADPRVADLIDRVAVPFSVNALGQAAAIASLGAPEELRARVAETVAERTRIERHLRCHGWPVPDPQANFIWLPAAHESADLAWELERRGVVTRPFPPHGVRVTIGSPTDNDLFLEAFEDASTRLNLRDAWALS